MTKLKYVLFLGSTRDGRLGERVANYVINKLTEVGHEITFIDPLKQEFDMLKRPLHFYGDRSKAPEYLRNLNEKIIASDGIIVVSPEYNHSIPPALANTIDHFPGSSFSWKPSGIVTYSPGQFGGVRAAMQLRPFLGEIGCISVSNILAIPKVQTVLDEFAKPLPITNKDQFDIDRACKKLFSQLEWWANAAKHQRAVETQ